MVDIPVDSPHFSVFCLRIADLDVFTESTMDFRVSAVKVRMVMMVDGDG